MRGDETGTDSGISNGENSETATQVAWTFNGRQARTESGTNIGENSERAVQVDIEMDWIQTWMIGDL